MTTTRSADSTSTRASIFLALALAGLLSQLAVAGVFLADQGFDLAEAGDQLLSSTLAVLSLADLAVCAVVYLLWLPGEAGRVGIQRWWPYALAVLGGLCFALPLFLSARETRLAAGGG